MSKSTTRTTTAKTQPAAATAKPTPAPAKTKPAPANCGCGCGQPTVTERALFLSGHDARHAGVVGRALAANPDDAQAKAAYDRMSDRLKVKTDGIRRTALERAAAKQAKVAARKAAEAAYAAALKEAGVR